MKIIIDNHIPYIREAAAKIFDATVYLAGADITRADVADADGLIVRTRTHCNAALLEGTNVKYVATATIGYDHLDTAFLDAHGIGWSNQPGCNATSVAQYVRNALYVLHRQGVIALPDACVGIVGVGHVGSAVAEALRAIGVRVVLNDPPLAEMGERPDLQSLATLQAQCDVITFHTPLTSDGPHPTRHLGDASFFDGLRRRPVIINAARGGVVDEKAMLNALNGGRIRAVVVDTWENEPNINRELLSAAAIATPHIAGYSADGKANATRMALEAVCRHFGLAPDFTITPPALPSTMQPAAGPIERALQLYNPEEDSKRLKADPRGFESQRNHYPLRREAWT